MVSLVIMAAGLGSRYKDGLKQLAKIGKNGETIMEYSINSAIKAGFNEVVFIIRKEIFDEFKNTIGKRLENKIKVRYVFQEIDNVPLKFKGINRTKPWGTGHAVMMLDKIDNPFVVINADDYYGEEIYPKMFDYLIKQDNNSYNYCMGGFKLKNTLSPNGGVSRGICKVINNELKEVVETFNITNETDIDMDSITSMNMWGFTPTILEELKIRFTKFLEDGNFDKEFFLPFVVDELIKENKANVKVIETNDKWYGITYSSDTENVRKILGGIEC